MTKEALSERQNFWKEVLGINKVIRVTVIPGEEMKGFREQTLTQLIWKANPVIMLSKTDNDVTLELSLIKALLRIKLAPYEQALTNVFNFLPLLEDGDLIVEALGLSFFDTNESILDELANAFYLAYERGGKQK